MYMIKEQNTILGYNPFLGGGEKRNDISKRFGNNAILWANESCKVI